MDQHDKQREFARLFAESEQALANFIFSLVPHQADADDILQETVSLLWEHFDAYDSQRPFLPWALKFAYRQVLKHRRQKRTKRRYFRESVMSTLAEEHPVDRLWTEVHRRAVEHCVKDLDESERVVLDARYFSKGNVSQLAAKLGRSVNALYKVLQRTRSKLMDCISAYVSREGFDA